MNVFKLVSVAVGVTALSAAVVGAVKAYKKSEAAKAKATPIVAESAEAKREDAPVAAEEAEPLEVVETEPEEEHQADVEAIEAALADPQKLEQLALRYNRGNKHDRKRTRSRRSADSGSGD